MAWSQEQLQERLDELAAKHKVVGAAAGIWSSGEQVVAATGTANLRSGVAVTTDTVFQIGSITKIYTATLVMQLVDEGLVELDRPVKTYLPDLRLGDPGATETITVRQLLAHTSGLEGDFFEDFGRGDDAISRYVEGCADLPNLYEPGTMMSYCNAGWVILGRVVEVLRDKPFARALTEHLLAPAGLHSSPTMAEEAIMFPVAVGHFPDPADPDQRVVAPQWSLASASAPAGALQCASIGDLLGFARLHLAEGVAPNGERVLTQDSARAMREPQVDLPDRFTLGDQWGLGWILMRWGGKQFVGHDGGTLGQSSFLRLLPGSDQAIGLLTNGGDTRALFTDLFNEILDDLAGVQMTAAPAPLEDAGGIDLQRYVGTYERHAFRSEVVEADGRLVLKTTVTGPLAKLTPPTPDKVLLPASDEVFLIPPDDPAGFPTPFTFFGFDDDGVPGWVHYGARAARRVT